MKRYRTLPPEEANIILNRATEPPGSGIYEYNQEAGVYVCRQCDLPLFLTAYQFNSGCGWPSFDQAFKGSVKEKPDGRRTEIVCNRCGGHLGHVFRGEGFTKNNTRHCVNSLSLLFVSAYTQEGHARAILAGGCFWGVEYFLEALPAVMQVRSGYIGGMVVEPTYEEVCTGQTGHAEAVEVVFDGSKTDYETLAKVFFEIHDPTQTNGQGPDIGPQYRSAVFFLTEQQKETSLRLIGVLKEQGLDVVTEVAPAGPFYEAEAYHQDYYIKKGGTPYCHKRVKRFNV